MDCAYADAFLAITNVNIKFNNNGGLLSNVTEEQLCKASVASGLKHISGADFNDQNICVSNNKIIKKIHRYG